VYLCSLLFSFFFHSQFFLFSEVFNVILNDVPELGVFDFNEGSSAEDNSLVQQINILVSSQFWDLFLSKSETFDDSFSLTGGKLVKDFFNSGEEIFIPEIKIILKI